MSRSFMILFMVSVDTWLIENLLLILNFYYCFYTLVKGNLFNEGVQWAIPWWHWSIFGSTKEIWRVCSWSETFIENWGDIIFSCILLFLFERCGLMLHEIVWSYYQQFGLFTQIYNQVWLSLKIENVTRIFWIVLEMWFDHYLLLKVFIKIEILILS